MREVLVVAVGGSAGWLVVLVVAGLVIVAIGWVWSGRRGASVEQPPRIAGFEDERLNPDADVGAAPEKRPDTS